MRLDFNVLWIDDQPAAIQSSVQRLERRMRDEGFQLQPTIVTSVGDAMSRLQGDVFSDHIDLVLVDFDLGQGPSGDVGLREIRGRVEYKEIIFYSSKPAADLKDLAFKQGVEGVYCSSRDDLIETTIGVFETLIKKVLDLDHTRGIVLGATSDIEHLVHDVLIGLHQGHDEEGKARIRAAALEKIREKLARLAEMAGQAENEQAIDRIFDLYDLLTAADKLRMLIHELKSRNDDAVRPVRQMMSTYYQSVVPSRTLLAHVRMQQTAEGIRVLRARDGRELSQDELRTLRRNLLDHRGNFFDLAKLLGIVPP